MDPRFLISRKLRHDFQAARDRNSRDASHGTANLANQQLEAVRRLWADAVSDIPYYSALVASRKAPREINSWDDFQSVPVLTRQAIQDQSKDFARRSGIPKYHTITAGSTGTPLRIGMNQFERDVMRVVKLAAWMKLGYTQSSRLFLIWGHSHLLGTGWKGRINHLKRRLTDAFVNYKRVDAYRLNRESCVKYAEMLLRFRPVGVIGYSSALDLFARYTSQFRERFRALGVRFVLATAEPMPNSDTIPVLEDLFHCPVVQEYGGAEFGQVAFKIGEAPFEVYSDLVYLEGLPSATDETQPDTALLTTLYARYFPLFRYQVGDALRGVDRLPNGHIRRFESIAGRVNDVIKFADGNSVHSVAIFHCIHQESSIHTIQMVIGDNGIEILLASTSPGDAAVENRIRKRLAQVHPLLANARVTYVEDVLTNRAGKRRWFIDKRSDLLVKSRA